MFQNVEKGTNKYTQEWKNYKIDQNQFTKNVEGA